MNFLANINPWLILSVSIVFEVIGTLLFKYSSQNNHTISGIVSIIMYILTFSLMWQVSKKLEVSITYAVWSGAGILLITIFGWLVFNENMSSIKFISILLIIAGVIGLNLNGTTH